MTNSAARVTNTGFSLGLPSETTPDHAGIPFFKGSPLPIPTNPIPTDLEGLIAGFLDCNEVIDLAATKKSPLKDNAAVQKTAAAWHAKLPDKCNALVKNIEKSEREAEISAFIERKRMLNHWSFIALLVSQASAFIGVFTIIVAFAVFSVTTALLVAGAPWLLCLLAFAVGYYLDQD